MTPFTLLAIGAALLGAIIGSFLNALSFRFNTGKHVFKSMQGRSRCMRCGHTLGAFDLVPILSFVFLRGRCRYCGSKISWQYPLVEAAAAALGLMVFLVHPGPLNFAFWFVVCMVLLFTAVYDLKHSIIPWSCSGLIAVLGLIWVGAQGFPLWALLAGPLLALPLFLLSLVSRGTWMGWGDGALELGLGWLMGITAGLSGMMLAFWSGAIVGIILMALTKKVTMKSEMPFAPFLILGALAAHFLHVDFFTAIGPLF